MNDGSEAMQVPLQITFRGIDPSDAIETRVRELAARLGRYHERITSCRVMIETPHRNKGHGKLYHVRIDITVPGAEIVVGREPQAKHAHEDAYVALRDAFEAARRRLQDRARRMRGKVKSREGPPHAVITRLFPEEGYGFLTTADGREVYFHRNAVLDGGFTRLAVGSEVRFTETMGEKGPQASTVEPVGKEGHRIVVQP